MAESCKAKHVQIPSKKHKKEIFNIQLINYYHSSLKGMTNIRFRGVATKYLNNYIVYNNFVTFAKESFMEKIKILKNEIFTFRVEKRSYSANISKENRYLYSRINTYSEQSQKNIKLCYNHPDPRVNPRVINYDYFYKENLCFRDLCLP